MKKAIVILLLTVAAFPAYAQKDFTPELSVGIKGGVSYSRFNFEPAKDQEFLQGYTGGIIIKHVAQRRVGVQMEVNYVQKGWTERLRPGVSYSRSLDYVEAPLLTHVTIGNRNTRFIVNLGPYAAYLISGGTASGKPEVVEGEEEPDTGYQFRSVDNSFEYGLAVGLGMVQKTSFGSFQLEARGQHSLHDIFSRASDALSSKNQNASLTLSYLIDFDLKEK